VYFASRRNLLRLCFVVCLCEPLFRLLLLATGTSPWALRELTLTRADSLLWGALGAIVVRDPGLLAKLKLPMKIAAGGAALVLLALTYPRGFLLYEAPEMVTAGYSLFGLLFGALIVFCAIGTGFPANAVSNPVLRWFGKYSYALYIAHPLVYLIYAAKIAPRLALGRFPAAIACFTAVTAASAAFAWVSWQLLENRFLRLKKHFEYRSEDAAPRPRTAGSAEPEEVAATS
jgi:peptidoglycan/LPS O-acetylase OafA/YrhL